MFHNCRYGIAAAAANYNVAITNNTFKIDDNTIGLSYAAKLPNNKSWFSHTNVPAMTSRYTLEHVGIGFFSGVKEESYSLISQNSFVNGLSLQLDSNPRFNGVVLSGAAEVDVSDNRFTNNDMGVVTHYSRGTSIENNFFEVTRRSAVDENFYQVVSYGPDNSSPNPDVTVLIKGNVFRNSSDVQRLSPVMPLEGNTYLTEGSGAIYSFGGVGGAVKIIENDISGFQIGIYTERGKNDLITKNTISADVYGIYALRADGLYGCNEITMDLESNVVGEAGVVGIRVMPETGTVFTQTFVFGNCVKNTDRAVFLGHLPAATNPSYYTIGQVRVQNNYLFNYTEAGLFVNNYISNGTQGRFIRRNAFISNQPNGVGSLGTGAFDVVTANSGGSATQLSMDDNYYGVDGIANTLAYSTDANDPDLITIIPRTEPAPNHLPLVVEWMLEALL